MEQMQNLYLKKINQLILYLPLDQGTRRIPTLCEKIQTMKGSWGREDYPVLTWSEYYQTVKENIDPLVKEDTLKVATSYLHDMGEVSTRWNLSFILQKFKLWKPRQLVNIVNKLVTTFDGRVPYQEILGLTL